MCLAVVHQLGGLPASVDWRLGAIADRFNILTPENGITLDHGVLAVGYGHSQGTTQAFYASGNGSGRRNLLSEDEVDGICSGKLGMAQCSHPGTNWYNTGGNLLSAFCWDHGTSTAMSVDETCTGMNVLNTTMTGDLTTSETFIILGSN